MNEFLHTEVLDNSILSYIVVLATILLAFLLKKFIAHYVASLFFFFLKKRYKGLEKKTFVSLIVKPLGLFIAILITVITVDKLKFPDALDIRLYRITVQELLKMIATAALVFSFFRFLIKCIDFIVLLINERFVEKHTKGSHQLVFFFKDFIKVFVGIIGLLVLLKYTFNYDVKGLLTGLSIVGAAIALALKESLENLIASFIIFFDKPFHMGDAVKGNNFSGVVERIGLRSTRIRTDAKTYVTVPNKQMVDSVLDNLSNRTQLRADIKLELSIDTAPEKLNTLLDGVNKILSVPQIQNYNLALNEIAKASIIITADYYTSPSSYKAYTEVKQKVNLEILELVDRLGINFTGKTTDINVVDKRATEHPE